MREVSTQTVQTMSSREIARLTGKRHPDVKRDIRVQLGKLGDVSKFAHTYLDDSNRKQTEYRLPRRETEKGREFIVNLLGRN